jgi:hypothetical protein
MMPPIEANFQLELDAIEPESIGWTPLGEGAYLHVADKEATEVLVVGLASAYMQSSNVLLVV